MPKIMRVELVAAALALLIPALAPVSFSQDKPAQSNSTQSNGVSSVRGQDQFSADRSPRLDSPSTWEAPFSSGGHVRLMLCSSGVEVSGTNEEKIEVHLKAQYSQDITHVRVSFKKRGDTGTLSISGCPHNNFEIALRIPQNSDLYTRMFAGDLEIHGVNGNKDIQIHAGDMNLSLGDATQYGDVDLSVTVGDLDAGAFNVSKDGLFRSWHRYASGKYSLYAHVGAGDLTLQ